MTDGMCELVRLVSDYYCDSKQFNDQYELLALKDAAEQGLSSFHDMCQKIFGKHTLEMYCALLSVVQEYLLFELDNLDYFIRLSNEAADTIYEFTKRRQMASKLLIRLVSNIANPLPTKASIAYNNIISISNRILCSFSGIDC